METIYISAVYVLKAGAESWVSPCCSSETMVAGTAARLGVRLSQLGMVGSCLYCQCPTKYVVSTGRGGGS